MHDRSYIEVQISVNLTGFMQHRMFAVKMEMSVI